VMRGRLNNSAGFKCVKLRNGVSPFIATVILVAITVAIGGVLYTEFSNIITAEVRDPSMALVASNVAADGRTITLEVKNDGNVQYSFSRLVFSYSNLTEYFVSGTNATVLAGSTTMAPGSLLSVQFTVTGTTLPEFSAYTLTVVTDQIAKSFSLQA